MDNVEKALEFIADGQVIGLGSGRAASRFIQALGERVRNGLQVKGVPTSRASAALATSVGIPLVALADHMPLDLTVDGADEVDRSLNLIKGFGHALVREKIVASASKRLVILIGPEDADEKVTEVLGKRGRLPIEVVPFGLPLCLQRLHAMGCKAQPVMDGDRLLVTDNGNHILEVLVSAIPQPAALEEQLRSIPGVVGTGLFIQMADCVLIQREKQLEIRQRGSKD